MSKKNQQKSLITKTSKNPWVLVTFIDGRYCASKTVSEIFVTIGNNLMPIMADYIFQKWSPTYFLSPMLLHNLVGLCGGLC